MTTSKTCVSNVVLFIGNCERGPYCNFIHVKEPSDDLKEYLDKEHSFKTGKHRLLVNSAPPPRGMK